MRPVPIPAPSTLWNMWKSNMYSNTAGSHGTSGSRCKCNPMAGILSDETWGLNHPDIDNEDKHIRTIMETVISRVDEEPITVDVYNNTSGALYQMARGTSIYNKHPKPLHRGRFSQYQTKEEE